MSEKFLSYTISEDSIHQFTLWASSPPAIDAWLSQVEAIIMAAQGNETLYFLVDFSHGLPALSYALRRGREMNQRIRESGKMLPTRLVLLYGAEANAFIPLIGASFGTLMRNHAVQWRFFPNSERPAALAWLQQAQKPPAGAASGQKSYS